jgi:predicted nucleic acid-binding protein
MQHFWFAEDDQHKVVSALVQIEARSAICRLRKEGRIALDEASFVLLSVDTEIRRVNEQPINPSILTAASAVIDRHYLRALDAIQLGCAIMARESMVDPSMLFVAADKDLLEAAKKEGFELWNPCE